MSDRLIVTRDVEQPKNGWTFVVPETGVELRGASAVGLRGKVLQHMRANSLPIPADYVEWFEDAMCRQQGYGSPLCGPPEPKAPPGTEGLTIAMVERFAKTLWSWARMGHLKPVDQATADARAATCIECPLNVTVGGCRGCRGILKRISETIGERKAAHHDQLKECGACGCTLSLKVWVTDDVLDKTEGDVPPKYAPGCWRLKKAAAPEP